MTHQEKQMLLYPVITNRIDKDLNHIRINGVEIYFTSFEFSEHPSFTYLYFYKKGVVVALIDLDDIDDEQVLTIH